METTLNKLRARNGNERGFTLLELIIVIAIIGILVAVALPVYGAVQHRAQVNAVAGSAKHAYNVAVSSDMDSDPATTPQSVATQMSNEKVKITVETPSSGNGDPCMSAAWKDSNAGVPTVYQGNCS